MSNSPAAKRRSGQRRPRPGGKPTPANGGQPKSSFERYTALARAAADAGDRIGAEYYYQHADHYFRIMSKRDD